MDGFPVSGLLLFLFMVVIYFTPAIIADVRGRDGKNMIALMNLLLGWTVLGWIILLVVAFTGRTQRDRDQQDEQLRPMRTLVAQQSLSAELAGQPLAVARAAPAREVIVSPPVPDAEPPPAPIIEDNRTLAEIMDAQESKT